ncbi:MAG TPA: DUF58 domain-containing protein [Miltoncostaeaceae bacterium]|nr:DUF58 domain-containing protein [Miltoncostaeaceae bacterium]
MSGPPVRALGLVGAGAAALIASQGFGTAALATLGAGLIALPVLVTALVWAVSSGLEVRRRIAPPRLRAGEELTVRLEVTGWPARAGLDRLLDLALDPGLGSVRGPGRPARRGSRVWIVRSAPRGEHHLPPPRVRVADPFGLARRTRVGAGDDSVVVTPQAPAIDRLVLGTRRDGRGPRRRLPLAGFGELDRVRDYQPGDPLSRVHWAQTAKRGRLQTKVLRAAEGTGRTVMVLVDGAAPAGDALELAVSAGAAAARHAGVRAEPFGLVHTGRRPARIPVGRATWPAAEQALTRLLPGGERSLSLALRAEASAPDPPELILVATSAGEPALPAAVSQARGLGVQVAVVLTGPAAAAAGDLAGAGADVAIVSGPDDLVAALSATDARARVS